MSSHRFPGKMLYNVQNKPILEYVIERVMHSKKIKTIILATSIEKSDDPIVRYALGKGIDVYRGSLNNVALRFFKAIDTHPCDAFVRICGDRPLLDQALIDHAIDLFMSDSYNLVTNVFPPTFPIGETVEVIDTKTYMTAYPLFTENEEKEHVTKYFYNNYREFSINNFTLKNNKSNIQFAIDNPTDIDIFSKIVAEMKRPHWEYSLTNILDIYDNLKNVESI